jgi:SAM-dependent methyltransferase
MKQINNNTINEFFSSGKINSKTDLCISLEKFGSDKCSDWHNYSAFYEFLYSEDRESDLRLFEVGIYGGSSVRAWQEYFKNSKIYCGDVNMDYFVNEGRIQSFFCDQDNPDSIKGMWENETLRDIQFDIIIDDGKHEYIPNVNFLENSYHKLKKGGIFIIEDLTRFTFDRFEERIEELSQRLMPSHIQLIAIPNEKNTIDNNILIIQK